MFIPKGHLKGFFISTGLLGVTVSAGVLASGSLVMFLKRNANEGYDPRVLNNTNQPHLENDGSGTMTDDKGTIWEYHNASNYANGHVSLNHEGYFGIKSNTPWGIPGITSITADFSTITGGELWLLKSVNGTEWHEVQKLADDEPTTWANDWRFVRFYFWDDNTGHSGSVEINSVEITYSCDHPEISATEAVDSARVENVIAMSSSLTATKETVDISPNSDGGEAIKFTKSGGGSTEITIGFNRGYTIKEIAMCKIEFDMKTANINYGKTVQLLGESFNSSAINSNNHSAYHCVSLGNNWYHIEVAVTCYATFISGYDKGDLPASGLADKVADRIKINAGACVIDNLRFGSTPDIEGLGLYNNGNSFSAGGVYWLKVAGTGVLHSCTMTFTTVTPNPSDPSATIAEQVPLTDPKLKNGSPFYIRGLNAGTVNVTATIVNRYNRQTVSITKQITVN